MGSPLGPTLANFFLAAVETKLLAQNSDCSPKLYVRYVDDIFAIFKEEKWCSKFLNVKSSTQKREIYDGKVNCRISILGRTNQY